MRTFHNVNPFSMLIVFDLLSTKKQHSDGEYQPLHFVINADHMHDFVRPRATKAACTAQMHSVFSSSLPNWGRADTSAAIEFNVILPGKQQPA